MAQVTFWLVTIGGSVGLTGTFFPGVAKHAASNRDAFLAAAMAGVLCALTGAFAASALVNALAVVWSNL
ncbi:MAG: hypothetical protein AAF449_20765 [Myxococcota bacterium]